jgi:hypothetical protein
MESAMKLWKIALLIGSILAVAVTLYGLVIFWVGSGMIVADRLPPDPFPDRTKAVNACYRSPEVRVLLVTGRENVPPYVIAMKGCMERRGYDFTPNTRACPVKSHDLKWLWPSVDAPTCYAPTRKPVGK